LLLAPWFVLRVLCLFAVSNFPQQITTFLAVKIFVANLGLAPCGRWMQHLRCIKKINPLKTLFLDKFPGQVYVRK